MPACRPPSSVPCRTWREDGARHLEILTGRRRAGLAVLALISVLTASACDGAGAAVSTRRAGAFPHATPARSNALAYGSTTDPAGGQAPGGVQIIPPSGSGGIDSAMNQAPTAATGSGSTGSGASGPAGGPSGANTPGGSPAQAESQLLSAYRTFLADISGLDDDFQSHWVQSLIGVASPPLVQVSTRAASTLQEAKEHGVGTLVDSHFEAKLSGGTATVSDCLDEYHWYIESDRASQPDPGVARGYFTSSGTAVWQNGKWIITSWTAGSRTCHF